MITLGTVLRKLAGWPGTASVLGVVVLNESLPLVFGTGYNARWDWGFPYVTDRWLLVPILAFGHLVYAALSVAVSPAPKVGIRTFLPPIASLLGALAYFICVNVP